MSSYPLVSLCLPVYNGAQFIPSLLNNIQQTTYPNLEIIISDDNSQDETLSLLRAAQLTNCRILTHSRLGLVRNWNYCVEQAKGKYIKFLFQDDTLDPDCITKMVEVAEKDEEIGLIFCPRNLIYEPSIDPKFLAGMQDLHKHWSNLQPLQAGLTLLEDPNFFNPPYNKIGEPTNVLIRRHVFEQIGGFDPSLKQLPDLEMWLRIMADYKVAFIDEKLATFQIHRNQTTNQNLKQDKIATLFEIYQVWLKLIFDKSYQSIPIKLRHDMRNKLLKHLLFKALKSVLLLRWHQAKLLTDLIQKTLK